MVNFISRFFSNRSRQLASEAQTPESDQVLNEVLGLKETLDQYQAHMEQQQAASLKTMRRIHLLLDHQGNILKDLQKAVLNLESKASNNPNPPVYGLTPVSTGLLDQQQVLSLLDSIHGLSEGDSPGGSQEDSLQQSLLTHLGWEFVTRLKERYHATDCEILEAIGSDLWEPGTVMQIIQQGYRDGTGRLIRRAKVIVAKGPVERDLDSQVVPVSQVEHGVEL